MSISVSSRSKDLRRPVSAKRRARFVASAIAARKKALESGKAYDAADVHEYLRRKIAGLKPARPKLRPWRA